MKNLREMQCSRYCARGILVCTVAGIHFLWGVVPIGLRED